MGVDLNGAHCYDGHPRDDLLSATIHHANINNDDNNNNLREMVTFRQRDLLTLDLREFTIVTEFLLPETLHRLVPPRFRKVLDRGGRIISFG